MQVMGLVAVAKKKFKVTTDSEHSLPIYKNILNRNFLATAINQKWACDITYIHTEEGWVYVVDFNDFIGGPLGLEPRTNGL